VGQLEIPQEVTLAGFTAAHEVGAVTVLNPAPAAELLEGLLVETDWLVPNEVEFEQLTGRPAHDDQALVGFSSSLRGRLLVTLGSDGVALVTKSGEVVRIPSVEVEAVDTTGAGDAFVGAFAFGLAAGLGELDAARLGNACAAQSVTRTGTQSSFPDRAGAQSILASLEKGT
jgi:ribokinase